MSRYYKLEGHTPVVCSNALEWAQWFESVKEERIVAKTKIGDIEVSTVFLGLDHSYNGKPLLFETMIFGGPLDQEMDRYTTWDEAVAGHAVMVERVKT